MTFAEFFSFFSPRSIFSILSFFVILAGCQTYRRQDGYVLLNPENIRKLKAPGTSQTLVHQTLGSPTLILQDGVTFWLYLSAKTSNSVFQKPTLNWACHHIFVFNKEGRLMRYLASNQSLNLSPFSYRTQTSKGIRQSLFNLLAPLPDLEDSEEGDETSPPAIGSAVLS